MQQVSHGSLTRRARAQGPKWDLNRPASALLIGVMMWLKLDNKIATHPKILAAGPLALAIQIRALCYVSQNQTDGFIPTNALPLLLTGLSQYEVAPGTIDGSHGRPIAGFGCSADDLDWPMIMVDNLLWEKTQTGFIIHDYLKWNLSKKQSDLILKKLSSAGKKGMKSRWKKHNPTDNQPYNETITLHSTSNSTSSSPSSSESEFEQFWTCFPKKVGKKAARLAWEKAKDRLSLVEMIHAVDRAKQSDQWRRDNGQYIPHPSTWLNQGRWADEPMKGLPNGQGTIPPFPGPDDPIGRGRWRAVYGDPAHPTVKP